MSCTLTLELRHVPAQAEAAEAVPELLSRLSGLLNTRGVPNGGAGSFLGGSPSPGSSSAHFQATFGHSPLVRGGRIDLSSSDAMG